MADEPVRGVDYLLVRKMWVARPFVTIITCLHDDCGGFDTGKLFETFSAELRYARHWREKHR